MRRTVKRIDAAALVKEMIEHGAQFRFTPAGTLMVDGLELLPRYLIDLFYDVSERELTTYLHAVEASDRQRQHAA